MDALLWLPYSKFTPPPLEQDYRKTVRSSEITFDNPKKEHLINYHGTIKIFLHEYGNDFTLAKHKVNDFFELEKGQIIKYYMKKTVVRSLPAKDRPCSRKRYYGLRSCIEDSVSI